MLIGNGGAEFGVRGYVSAYDAETGKLAWRFYTVPGDPAERLRERRRMAMAAKTWTRRVVEARRRRHGLGRHRLRPRARPRLRRHRQRLARGTSSSAARAAATTCSSPRSSRSTPTPASTSGTTRPRRARRGTTPRRSTMMLADLTIDGAAAQGADAGAEERLLLRARPHDRRADLGASTFVPVNWASGVDLKTGRPIENPEARYDQTGKVAFVTPRAGGAHNWQPMAFSPRPGSSTSARATTRRLTSRRRRSASRSRASARTSA